VPALCELLAHPHPNAIQVVRALQEIGNPSAVPAVLHRMGRSDEPEVVIACLNALGGLGDGTIIGALVDCLSDSRTDVAPTAATAIASIAERHSFREAAVAVRAIRARLSILRRTSEMDRATYRQAIVRLESMASTISSLPMPASHRGHEDALPVPSQQDVEPER